MASKLYQIHMTVQDEEAVVGIECDRLEVSSNGDLILRGIGHKDSIGDVISVIAKGSFTSVFSLDVETLEPEGFMDLSEETEESFDETGKEEESLDEF